MATRIQAKTQQQQAHGDISIALDSAPADGNLLVAIHVTGSGSAVHNAPAGWTKFSRGDGSGSGNISIYWKIASSDSATVTAYSDSTSSNSFQTFAVIEYSGQWPSSPVDQIIADDVEETQRIGPTGTLSSPDQLVIAAFCAPSGRDGVDSWSNGFTEFIDLAASGGLASLAVADREVSSTNPVSTTITPVDNEYYFAALVTFEEDRSGGEDPGGGDPGDDGASITTPPIVDTHGNVQSGVTVFAIRTNDANKSGSATTNSNGVATISVPEAGDYILVSLSSAGYTTQGKTITAS